MNSIIMIHYHDTCMTHYELRQANERCKVIGCGSKRIPHLLDPPLGNIVGYPPPCRDWNVILEHAQLDQESAFHNQILRSRASLELRRQVNPVSVIERTWHSDHWLDPIQNYTKGLHPLQQLVLGNHDMPSLQCFQNGIHVLWQQSLTTNWV